MRWIYLSPHLDDAVLSAGGLIHEQTGAGTPVEIWTFMCGYPPDEAYSPFAQLLHSQWGFSSAGEGVRLRREEDRNAAARVGATVSHFDFLDCIYRRAENGDWLYSQITDPPRPEDADIPARIVDVVRPRLEPDDVLVCQLAVGSHVDHVLVRQAAERLDRPLLYDVDIPYLFYKPEEVEPRAAGMRETLHPISESGLKAWQEGILEYKSQFPVLGDAFDTPEKASAAIRGYWGKQKGIALWGHMG